MANSKYANTSTVIVSTNGGTEVLSVSASTASAGSDQACKEVVLWSPDSDIYFTIGSSDASASDVLLPANAALTIQIDNTNKLRFYNNGASSETVNIIWRT
jgi:hypothetical protein